MVEQNAVQVAIAGAAGRMGRRLCALAVEMDGVELAEAFEAPGHTAIGEPAAPGSAVAITDRYRGEGDGAVVIDFTTPISTRALLEACAERGAAIVIGTTGLTEADDAAIDRAGEQIAVLHATNFSLVVNVLNVLAARAAQLLGDAYDIEIVEAHHRFKKDAPSGTALTLAREICAATGRSFSDDVLTSRAGDDVVRRPREITVQALRLGDVVGEHTVMFGAPGERMELRHIGASRDSYAGGALRAARWLHGRAAGRYTMKDVLGLDA